MEPAQSDAKNMSRKTARVKSVFSHSAYLLTSSITNQKTRKANEQISWKHFPPCSLKLKQQMQYPIVTAKTTDWLKMVKL